MKKLILNLALIILTFSIISSCQKEKMNADANVTEMVQQEQKSLEEIKTNALQYKALAEKNQEKTDAELQVLKQKIEKLQAERSQLDNQSLTTRSGNGPIRVPQDYPSLQAAVDNSTSGGKIFIQGAVSEPGDVLVNVPGLTIQGQGASPTINGSSLMITAAGITVQNLKVNMATVISGTSNTTLTNSTFSATNNNGAMGPLLVLNSSNNSIKNCTVDGAYAGGTHEFGIYMDNLSNHNEIQNCTSKNTDGAWSPNSSAFVIDGADNSLENCTALNFIRGFKSAGNDSKNNQFTGCVANNSLSDAGFVFLLPDGNHFTLENCTANNNLGFGFFISGGSCNMSKCTANDNTAEPESLFGIGVFVLFGDFEIEKSTFKYNSKFGALIYDVEAGYHTGTLEKDTTESNGWFGIYLLGLNNSNIEKNISTSNPVCDFNQTACSGNTLADNNFGTSCTGL